MSTTSRYAKIVFKAVKKLDDEAVAGDRSYWLSAGEVASRAGVSEPTARKYLRKFVEDKAVTSVGGSKTTLYALVLKV